jgi:hypothetical protein
MLQNLKDQYFLAHFSKHSSIEVFEKKGAVGHKSASDKDKLS